VAREQFVAGIDVGSTKTVVTIAELKADGTLQLRGAGMSPSKGLRKGIVISLEDTAQSIAAAMNQAQIVSGVTVTSACVSISGEHITSENSRGGTTLPSHTHDVNEADVVKALDAARAAPAEASREIVLVVPRNFTVDGQTGIRNPIGMTGHRLDAETHVISGSIGMIQNLEKAIHMAGITLEELVLQGLAAGGATTTEDERELGCVVIDIGGGTTDIAVYMAGSIWHTAVLPFGGGDITHDLAFCLRTSVANAESLKMRYGNAVWTADSEDRDLQIEAHGGATNLTTVGLISQIIQARVEDMFRLIRDDLARKGLSNALGAGVILTGGSSNLPGIREVAEEVLALPVRIGLPTSIPGLGEGFQSPSYATSIGLLKWGQEKLSESHPAESKGFSLWDALTDLFRKAIRPFSSAPAR